MRVFLTLTVALLLLPATARGASVSAMQTCDDRSCPIDLTYIAAPGEVNRLRITQEENSTVFHDEGAQVTAGGGCTARSPNEVICAGRHTSQRVDLGDGDDRVDTTRFISMSLGPGDDISEGGGSVFGGSGADQISRAGGIADGGPGADTLIGGDGDNVLAGGAGPDELRGGLGDDRLVVSDGTFCGAESAPSVSPGPDVPAADVADGGPGNDTLAYGHCRRAGVTVDLLDGEPEGVVDEGDTAMAIENAEGGRGPDALRGDDGPNRLDGLDGADFLAGRGGSDRLLGDGSRLRPFEETLDGGSGDDEMVSWGGTVRGGPGNDRISGFGPRSRTARCGSGNDIVVGAAGGIVSPTRDCERFGLRLNSATASFTRPVVRGGVLRLSLPCPRGDVDVPYGCRVGAALRSLIDSPLASVQRLRVARGGRRAVVLRPPNRVGANPLLTVRVGDADVRYPFSTSTTFRLPG